MSPTKSNFSDESEAAGSSEVITSEGITSEEPTPLPAEKKTDQGNEKPPWHTFLKDANDTQITERINSEVSELVKTSKDVLTDYCFMSLYDPEGGIDSWDSNRVFTALRAANSSKSKNVFLFVVSRGGEIEPAYQISKICKAFAKEKFVVVVPRAAKSAATLIALGADEIHMGMLGELGPIDPQVDGLPALGVQRALETIAAVCEKYPKSAEAFARYMSRMISIEQIGYCQRVGESALQYAERLLTKKPSLAKRAEKIAFELVYEYKDHSFVIDLEEAKGHLGETWIKGESPELTFAEDLYQRLDWINLLLGMFQKKKFTIVGNMESSSLVFPRN